MQPIECDDEGRAHCCFDEQVFDGLVEAVQHDPAVGQTKWSAATRWYGGFKSEATIRGFRIGMDEPESLGGTNTGPNMVEVVLGALGCCLTTGYAANAKKRGINLLGIEVDCEGDLDLRGFFGLADPTKVWPGYSAVRVVVRLLAPGASDAELQALHEAVVATCPVRSILVNPVAVRTDLEIASLPVC
jgi:uncharacterized OsmC-like protein